MFEKEVDELKLNFDNALQHRENAEYKLAIEALYKALDVEPNNIEVLTQLAEIYALMNDLERSIQYYKDIIEIDENNLSAICALFNKYFTIGKFKDALFYAQKAVSLSPSDKNYIQLVSVYDKFSDIKSLRDLVQSCELSHDVLLKIASVFINHAFVADAEALFDKISDCDEKDALCALIYFNKNELEKAKALVMNLNLESVEVLNLKGLFYIEEMRFVDAIKCFAKAASLEPSNPKYYFNLGNAYFYNGWMSEAADAYRKAIELDVTNVDYRFALANLYFETKDYPKARLEVANILHIDEEHLDTKVLVALLKFADKDYLGAKEDLEKVLQITPDNDFVNTSLAKVLIELKLFDKAENLILNVISHDSQNSKSLCVLAHLFTEQKRYKEALELVENILEKNKFYMPAYTVGMKAAYGTGDTKLVQKYAQDSIAIDINFANGYYYLALIRKSENDFDEAVECMKRAIMYDLNNPEYYAEMARIYQEDDDVKSALEYANEAIAIDNSSAEYMMLYSDLAARNRKICQEK